MSDDEMLERMKRMVETAQTEKEWKNRKDTVEVIKMMAEKMLEKERGEWE